MVGDIINEFWCFFWVIVGLEGIMGFIIYFSFMFIIWFGFLWGFCDIMFWRFVCFRLVIESYFIDLGVWLFFSYWCGSSWDFGIFLIFYVWKECFWVKVWCFMGLDFIIVIIIFVVINYFFCGFDVGFYGLDLYFYLLY